MNKTRSLVWMILIFSVFLLSPIFSSRHANALTLGAEMSAFSLQETLPVSNKPIPCPMNLPEGEVDGETINCGQLTVPENWETPGENRVNITYAILKAKSGVPFDEPIIYLEGGPGGSALEDIEKLSGYFSKLRETRDFIYYDQRGTAYSSNLECPSAIQAQPLAGLVEAVEDESETDEDTIADDGEATEPDGEDEQAAVGEDPAEADIESDTAIGTEFDPLPIPVPYLDQDPQESLETQRAAGNVAETGCFDYFQEQGLDLTQYNTANSVRDLTALMQALDYDVYNIYGISYGSRLGLELLRVYEDAGEDTSLPEIRSVVIDGIDPPHVDMITQAPFAPMLVTLRLLADCEAEEACGTAFPDIRQRALNLVVQVEETPLDIVNSEGMTESVTLDALATLLKGNAVAIGEDDTIEPIGYDKLAPYLPLLVDELSNGIGDTYLGLTQGLLPPEEVAESSENLTLFDPLAARSQQLADEADTLAQALEMLAGQAQRSAEALGDEGGLPEFFVRELIQFADEQAIFEELGLFGKVLFRVFALQESNRATLTDLVEFLELDETGQSTLNAIVHLMDEDEIAKTVALVMSDQVLEQLISAIQDQMNTVVLCNDTYSQLNLDDAFERYRSAEAPQLLNLPGMLEIYILRCEHYQLLDSAGESADPVVSDMRILVANGGIDITTPAEWGISAAEYLPNAQLVTIPMFDHGATAKSACGQDIVRHFFTYPDQEVDDGCTEELKPAFALPDNGN